MAENTTTEITCATCEHLITVPRLDFYPPSQHYNCGHPCESELDENSSGKQIGFLPVTPDWCPLVSMQQSAQALGKLLEPPEMHYLVVHWDQGEKEWKIDFYSHEYNNMIETLRRYPEDKGYVHLIELKYLKAHEIMEKVRAMREKAQEVK